MLVFFVLSKFKLPRQSQVMQIKQKTSHEYRLEIFRFWNSKMAKKGPKYFRGAFGGLKNTLYPLIFAFYRVFGPKFLGKRRLPFRVFEQKLLNFRIEIDS